MALYRLGSSCEMRSDGIMPYGAYLSAASVSRNFFNPAIFEKVIPLLEPAGSMRMDISFGSFTEESISEIYERLTVSARYSWLTLL